MKPLLLTIAALTLLVCGALLGHLIEAKPDLAPQLAASEERARSLEKQVHALQDGQDSREAEIAALKTRLSTSRPAPVRSTGSKRIETAVATPAPTPEATGPAGKGYLKAMSQMMKNPAMREMAKSQQAAMRDMAYGDLYTALHFNDEDKAYFKQLLADRASAETELGFRLMDPSLTPEARQAALDENKQQKDQSNAAISAFLDNANDYQSFQHYEQTQGERMMLAMNKAAFDSEPLTPQQATQLVDTMHDVAMRSGNAPDSNRSKSFDPSQFTQAALDEQIQKFDSNAQAVNNAAATFLSPNQQAILKQVQANQRAMTITGWQMMKSFGGAAK